MAQSIAVQSNSKVDWVCSLGHTFSCSVDKVTSRGQWCPFCAGKQVLAGFNDLYTLNPSLASELVGIIDPREVAEWSHKYGLWRCPVCSHEWESKVSNRSLGRGCPRCSRKNTSRGEDILRSLLREFYTVSDDHLDRVHIPWRSRSSFQVDALLREERVVVEYDGAYWHHKDVSMTRDVEKTSLLLSNNYRIIRVRETSHRYPFRPISVDSPRVLQIPYEYPDNGAHHLEDVIPTIREWIDNV